MKPKAKISRRQFLTGVFRGRNLALAERGKIGAHDRSGRSPDSATSRDLAAPDSAPSHPDWSDGMRRVLEQLEDTRGIEDS